MLLSSIIAVLIASPLAWIIATSILACVSIGVEAIARRRFLPFLASTVLLLCTVALGVGVLRLFLSHWRIAASLLIGVAALALLIANVKGDT